MQLVPEQHLVPITTAQYVYLAQQSCSWVRRQKYFSISRFLPHTHTRIPGRASFQVNELNEEEWKAEEGG